MGAGLWTLLPREEGSVSWEIWMDDGGTRFTPVELRRMPWVKRGLLRGDVFRLRERNCGGRTRHGAILLSLYVQVHIWPQRTSLVSDGQMEVTVLGQ